MFLFLIFTYLWVFQFSFHYWFLVSFLVIEKHTFYNFSLLRCVKTSFMALHVIYPGECSLCTRKDILLGGVFICLLGPVELVLFVLCILESGILKSPVIILLSVSLFSSVSVFFLDLGALLFGMCIFIIVISSWWIDPFYHFIIFFVSCKIFDLKCVLFNAIIASALMLFNPRWNSESLVSQQELDTVSDRKIESLALHRFYNKLVLKPKMNPHPFPSFQLKFV